jgi:predicted nucleotidyltransferase
MVNAFRIVKILGHKMYEEIPVRQLSIESGVPNTTVHRILSEERDLFRINKKGNIKLVSLNLKDQITKSYLIISERKNTEIILRKDKKLGVLIKEIPKGNFSVLLFGSRASGRQRKDNDYDIIVISEKGDKIIDFNSIENLYDVEINPINIRRKEFEEMIKETKHNLSDEVIRNHIILYGEEYFWNIIWRYRNEIRQKEIS